MKAWMFLIECADGAYYCESTKNLPARIEAHQKGRGSRFTSKRLPLKLVYFEEFNSIDEARKREKQVKGWRREKKEALIRSEQESLPELAMAYRDKHSL